MNTLEEEIDMTTDEALISALTPKQLGEIELEPYSLVRQAIAYQLRRGNNVFLDAIVTVWLCTLSEGEVLRASEDKDQGCIAACKWAEALGYSIVNCKPIMDIYTKVNNELAVSTGARLRDGEDGDVSKNVGEPPR